MGCSERLRGGGVTPIAVANGILLRAFHDGVDVTPMKLQRLLYMTACFYQSRTGNRLLCQRFQPWRYGPVCASVHDAFACFGAGPITVCQSDAGGCIPLVDEDSCRGVRVALDVVWAVGRDCPSAALSRVVCARGGAWADAVARGLRFIDDGAVAGDCRVLGFVCSGW